MVNINDVYQKVLIIANKEQRGYITPQEFNLMADKAQLDIINDYFHKIKTSHLKPKNSSEISDELEMVREKMNYIKARRDVTAFDTSSFSTGNPDAPGIPIGARIDLTQNVGSESMYMIAGLKTNFEDAATGVWKNMEITEVDNSEIDEILNNPLTYPSRRRPIYVRRKNYFTEGSNTNSHNLVIDIYPSFDADITVSVEYFKKPKHPSWGFVVVNQKPLYNLNTSINFELHPAEEEPLVTRILTLAGVVIEKPGLVQGAMADQQVTKQNQNS
jgi:hypothetical protein